MYNRGSYPAALDTSQCKHEEGDSLGRELTGQVEGLLKA